MRVGSSKVIKTDVRVVAATNVNVPEAIEKGKFREDLFYRLNTVPISVPSLRDRKDDIYLLFRKFASDFSVKYRMPPLRLTPDARQLLVNFRWKGNVRQLKNITEQISIIEKEREVNAAILSKYLPDNYLHSNLPVIFKEAAKENEHLNERDLLYKVLFDMKRDLNDLKKLVRDIMSDEDMAKILNKSDATIIRNFTDHEEEYSQPFSNRTHSHEQPAYVAKVDNSNDDFQPPIQESEVVEESLSLQDKEIELIIRALRKHNNKRKNAAEDLGISERTLYRKIKEYKLGK